MRTTLPTTSARLLLAPLPQRRPTRGAAAVAPRATAPSTATAAAGGDAGARAPARPKAPATPPVPDAAWAAARALQADGTTLDVIVTSVNRGGVVVDVPGIDGLSGFIPASKLDPARLPAAAPPPKSLVGTPLRAKVVQVDAARRKLILSERAASLGELAGAVAEGQILTGVVTRLTDYGAFVSLQSPSDGGLHGAEGLIHMSELSWDAVLTPEAVVQPGTVVRVRVLRADPARGRVELSLKRMEADPLTETLDALLPLEDTPAADAADGADRADATIPAAVGAVCAALRAQPGVDALRLGRQVEEKRAVSQDLEVWMSREVVADGFILVARAGRFVQEVHVTTRLEAGEVRAMVARVLKGLA